MRFECVAEADVYGNSMKLRDLFSDDGAIDGPAGDIDVSVQTEVNARASGSGRITVHGDPLRRTLSGKRVSIVR